MIIKIKKILPFRDWYLAIFSVLVIGCLFIILWLMGMSIKAGIKEQEKLTTELNLENNTYLFRHKKAILIKSMEENTRRLEKRIAYTKGFIIVIEVLMSLNLIWFGYKFLSWLKEY